MLLLLSLLSVACSRSSTVAKPDGFEVHTLRYEGNPGVVSPVELAEDLGYLAPLKLDYVGANATGGPHSIQAVVSGDIDIGGSFNGAIAKLVGARAPLQAVVAAYGTDEENFQGFFVLEGSPIKSAKDLIGKKVSMNTLGAHAEFALREFLRRGGLSEEQTTQVAMIALPAANGELALRERQVDMAILGNLHRVKAVARGGIRLLGSDFALFGKFNAGSYVMSKKFLADNPKAAQRFAEGVGRALDWANETPRSEVIARFAEIITRRKRNEDTSIVKHWIGYGVSSKGGVLAESEFQIWLDWLIKDGQLTPGALKPTDVFTNQLRAAPSASAQRADDQSASIMMDSASASR
jgi:ABC-type nitrate/sulfonate/bicarbonate transport system substrate-binding protein